MLLGTLVRARSNQVDSAFEPGVEVIHHQACGPITQGGLRLFQSEQRLAPACVAAPVPTRSLPPLASAENAAGQPLARVSPAPAQRLVQLPRAATPPTAALSPGARLRRW